MGVLVLAVLLICLIASVPIALSLGIAASVGLFIISPEFLITMPQKVLSGMDSFTLLAIPLFIFAGTIMGHGGIAGRIVNMSLVLVGRVRGGLGMVVVFGSMFFSGVCGSASADTAAIGSITMPEMLKRKYPAPFATALLAAAGGTATIVPPSIDLIIIGVVASISIGGLFAAGFLPGLVNALALIGLVYYYGRKLNLPLIDPMSLKAKAKVFGDGIFAVSYTHLTLPTSDLV